LPLLPSIVSATIVGAAEARDVVAQLHGQDTGAAAVGVVGDVDRPLARRAGAVGRPEVEVEDFLGAFGEAGAVTVEVRPGAFAGGEVGACLRSQADRRQCPQGEGEQPRPDGARTAVRRTRRIAHSSDSFH